MSPDRSQPLGSSDLNVPGPRGGETAIEVGLRHRQIGESCRKQQLPDTNRPQGLGAEARPGSESRANAQQDYPGTWETMPAPPRLCARAVPRSQGTTEDGEIPFQPGSESPCRLVQDPPTPTHQTATRDANEDAQGARRLLWYHRKWSVACRTSTLGGT